MDTRQVTIFGGSGFLGRHTVRALARAGWRIRVACRYPNQGFFLKPAGQVGQIALTKCDITDSDQVAAALKGSNAVINLVGVMSGHVEDIQITGAGNIAEAAAAAGITSLVHISAIGADTESNSAYAQSKAKGGARVRDAFPTAVVLRPSIVFGPEDQFFNKFADLARYIPVLPLIGGGKTRFQPVFVGDVAAAIVTALDSDTAKGRTYELGGPMTYTFRELLQVTLAEIGRRRALVPVPFALAMFKAFFLQFAPGPLKLTPDQVKLLRADNVVSPTALGLGDLGIKPTTLEAELPAYLWRYRARGEYADLADAKVKQATL